jgi:hypothetical protein
VAGPDLRDRFETIDGSRPDASPLGPDVEKEIPLLAFQVLAGGDAFEGGRAPAEGAAEALRWFEQRVKVKRHFCPKSAALHVQTEIAGQLASNPKLVERLWRARPIVVDLVPEKKKMSRYGFPPQVDDRAAGLFWDHPSWPKARVALRMDRLYEDEALVVHEMAHAIHYLAFTQAERDLIYKVLRPTFGSRAAMDEVFAIYSEREFLASFSAAEKRAPGVYGVTRRQWDENHLFTRFIRKLYFPHKKLAGHEMGGPRTGWSKYAQGR